MVTLTVCVPMWFDKHYSILFYCKELTSLLSLTQLEVLIKDIVNMKISPNALVILGII